jgi:hypothetical protein
MNALLLALSTFAPAFAPQQTQPAQRVELSAAVADATPEQRVVLEPEALENLLAKARALRERSSATCGARELDAAAHAELAGDSAAHRGELFRLHGTLTDLQVLAGGELASTAARGRLALECGREAHFVAAELPLGMDAGDWVSCDGFFLKRYSRAVGDEWVDAPLFVARALVRSTPPLAPVHELAENVLAAERDDTLADGDRELASDGLWHVLSYATSGHAIDWTSAPVLGAELFARWRTSGASERGLAVRIDSALLVRCDPVDAGENPLRWPSVLAGWLAPWSADDGVALVQFVAAPDAVSCAAGERVDARGYFLRQVAFERRPGVIELAPLVVVSSVSPAAQARSGGWTALGVALVGLGVTVLVGLWILRRETSMEARAR